MGIDDYFNKKSRVEQADKLSMGKSKKKRRTIEQQLLKPDKLPVYKGKKPAMGTVESRTIKIICDTDGDVDLIRKYFKVSEYKGLNIRYTTLLMKLLDALEEGGLEYDKEEETLYFIGDQGQRIPL